MLYDGEVKDHKLACIELYSEKNGEALLHTLRLEHLRFSDKSYLQQEARFVVSIKKEKHVFEFDTVENKEDWVQSLCHVSPELWKQRASARGYSNFKDSDSSLSMNDNLLYDSCDKGQCLLGIPCFISVIDSWLPSYVLFVLTGGAFPV